MYVHSFCVTLHAFGQLLHRVCIKLRTNYIDLHRLAIGIHFARICIHRHSFWSHSHTFYINSEVLGARLAWFAYYLHLTATIAFQLTVQDNPAYFRKEFQVWAQYLSFVGISVNNSCIFYIFWQFAFSLHSVPCIGRYRAFIRTIITVFGHSFYTSVHYFALILHQTNDHRNSFGDVAICMNVAFILQGSALLHR